MIFRLDRKIFLKWLTGNISPKVYWDQIQGGTKSDFSFTARLLHWKMSFADYHYLVNFSQIVLREMKLHLIWHLHNMHIDAAVSLKW